VIENIFRTIMYIIMGIFTWHILLLSLVSFPGAVAGFFIGSKVDTKLGEDAIRRIVISMFMLGGFSIILKAVIWRT
jgi:uncharacterized membrane protein YfcA